MDVSAIDRAPSRWGRRPLWSLLRRKDIVDRTDLQLLSVYRDHGVVPTSSRDDNFNKPSEDLSSYRYVAPNDLVLNKMKTWQGSLAVSNYEGIVSPAYIVCEIAPNFHPRFAHYLLRSKPYVHIYQALSKGIRPNQWDLSFDEFRTIPALVPSMEEQRRIADFLDAETSRIDSLIDHSERSIFLLDEKSLSFSERMVLRGVDEQCEVSYSGIKSVGVIPRHWKVVRNKYLLREVMQLSATGDEELLTVSHLSGVTPRSEKEVYMFMAESHKGYKKCLPGDLVINTMWAWMGALGISRYAGIVSPAYGVYRPEVSEFIGDYFNAFYRSRAYVCEMTRHSKGVWSSRLRLYPESFLSLKVAVPPVGEQRAIVERVEAVTSTIGKTRTYLQEFIRRLSERRQALIAAAVTGQLDVTTARSGVRV